MQIAFKSWDFAFSMASAGMILMNAVQTDVHYHKEMIYVYFFLPLNTQISGIQFFFKSKNQMYLKTGISSHLMYLKRSYKLSKSLQLCYTCI